jgi:outer membrane protein assembly factor BamB
MSHVSDRKAPIWPPVWRPFAAGLSLLLFVYSVHAALQDEPPEKSPGFIKCWEYQAAPDLTVNAVADNASVYFFDTENKLNGVDLISGAKIWSTELGGDIVSNLFLADESIFVVTSSAVTAGIEPKAVIWSISRQTGITEWRTEISRSPSAWLGASSGNILVIGSDGVVSALGSAHGELIWRKEIGANVSSDPYFDDTGASMGTSNKQVVSLGIRDGRTEVLWKSEHTPTAVYFNSRSRLLIGDERGNLFSIPVGSDPSWRFKKGARISRVLSNGVDYLLISNDNFVYNMSRGGDVRWKRRLPGRVAGAPLALGETLAVSIVGAGDVYLLDLDDGKISNRIETNDEASAGIAGRTDGKGFAMTGVTRVSYFSSDKCSVK